MQFRSGVLGDSPLVGTAQVSNWNRTKIQGRGYAGPGSAHLVPAANVVYLDPAREECESRLAGSWRGRRRSGVRRRGVGDAALGRGELREAARALMAVTSGRA